jgi:Domain of unknown function (DUF4328)
MPEQPQPPQVSSAPASPRADLSADEKAQAERESIAKLGPPRRLGRWAGLASLGLVLVVLATGYIAIADLGQLDILDRATSANPANRPTLAEANDSDDEVQQSGAAFLAAYVVGGLMFIGFFHAAYINQARLGARGFRYSFGQSIWAWFVPFFNLVRPKQIANDIWRGSNCLDPSEPRAWREAPVAPLVHWWWALYLVSGFGIRATSNAYSSSDSISGLRGALWAEIGFTVVQVIALALAFTFISRIARAQSQSGPVADVPAVRRVPSEVITSLIIVGAFIAVGVLYYGLNSTDEGVSGKASSPPHIPPTEQPSVPPYTPPTFTLGTVEPQRGGEVTMTATLPKQGQLVAGDKADRSVGPTLGGGHPYPFPILLIARTIPVRAAGEITFTLKPTERARSLLEDRGSLKAKIKVVYRPRGKSSAQYRTANVTLQG